MKNLPQHQREAERNIRMAARKEEKKGKVTSGEMETKRGGRKVTVVKNLLQHQREAEINVRMTARKEKKEGKVMSGEKETREGRKACGRSEYRDYNIQEQRKPGK